MKAAFLLLVCLLVTSAHASRIATVSRTGNAALVFVDQGENQSNRPEIWSISPWKRRCIMRSSGRKWSDNANPAFSCDGHLIAFGCEDSTIEIYDTRRGRLWGRLGRPEHDERSNYGSRNRYEITALAFSPDGKMLASSNIKGVFLWNWRTRKLLFSRPVFSHPEINGELLEFQRPANLREIQFSPNGKTIALAGGSAMPVFLFDIARKRVRLILRLHAEDGRANVMAFSPGGNRLLVVGYWNVSGGSHDQIQMFDTRNGRALWRWDNESKDPYAYANSSHYNRAAFSSDGRRFAAANDDFLSIWDAHTACQKEMRMPKEEAPYSLQTQKTLLPELVMR